MVGILILAILTVIARCIWRRCRAKKRAPSAAYTARAKSESAARSKNGQRIKSLSDSGSPASSTPTVSSDVPKTQRTSIGSANAAAVALASAPTLFPPPMRQPYGRPPVPGAPALPPGQNLPLPPPALRAGLGRAAYASPAAMSNGYRPLPAAAASGPPRYAPPVGLPPRPQQPYLRDNTPRYDPSDDSTSAAASRYRQRSSGDGGGRRSNSRPRVEVRGMPSK